MVKPVVPDTIAVRLPGTPEPVAFPVPETKPALPARRATGNATGADEDAAKARELAKAAK